MTSSVQAIIAHRATNISCLMAIFSDVCSPVTVKTEMITSLKEFPGPPSPHPRSCCTEWRVVVGRVTGGWGHGVERFRPFPHWTLHSSVHQVAYWSNETLPLSHSCLTFHLTPTLVGHLPPPHTQLNNNNALEAEMNMICLYYFLCFQLWFVSMSWQCDSESLLTALCQNVKMFLVSILNKNRMNKIILLSLFCYIISF